MKYNLMFTARQRDDGSLYRHYYFENSETEEFVRDIDDVEKEHISKQLASWYKENYKEIHNGEMT